MKSGTTDYTQQKFFFLVSMYWNIDVQRSGTGFINIESWIFDILNSIFK